MGHLESNHIISDFQYSFRPSHSCEAQLISVTEEIKAALDHRKQVDLLMLDFSKAYDTVPHKCLLSKLEYYGIYGKLLSWLTTWLTKRVVIDGYASSLVDVLSGVPQGTVLGPVMFLLYINDISESISSLLCLFADDCIVYRAINSEEDHQLLQSDLDLIYT